MQRLPTDIHAYDQYTYGLLSLQPVGLAWLHPGHPLWRDAGQIGRKVRLLPSDGVQHAAQGPHGSSESVRAEPCHPFGTAELDETFVLDCYKGAPVPESAGWDARGHGAKAAKRGISNEYVEICTGIQRDGGVVAETVNRAKPSGAELEAVLRGHIAKDTLILVDGLRSYNVLETLAECTVVDINHEERNGMFNLNTVNSQHSYIKET